MVQLLRLALALALFVGAPEARAEPAAAVDGVSLPSVRWQRSARLLTLHVEPEGGTHLSPDLPLRAMIFDGLRAVAERNGAVPDAGRPARVQLPILLNQAGDGWELTLDGGVCSDDGALCVPFHVIARVPSRGAPRGRLGTEPGRGPADVFESPPRPQHEPAGQPPRDHLAWFDAARPGDVEAAFQDAQARGTAILADFFAVWCPPCDLLRDEFLHAPPRHDLLSKFTLLRLDADSPASFPLKDRYAVTGYPTVLVLAGDGGLLDRIVGYPGAPALAERLAAHVVPVSVQELRRQYAEAPAESKVTAGLALSARLAATGALDDAWAVLLQAVESPRTVGPAALPWVAELAAELGRPEAVDLAILRADQPGPLDERAGAVLTAAALLREADGPNAGQAADAYLALQRPALLAELREQTAATVAWTADGSGADVKRRIAGGPARQWRLVDAAYALGTWPDIDAAEARDLLAIGASASTLGILQSEGRAGLGPADLQISISLRPTIGAVTVEQADVLRRHEGRYHDLVSLLVKADLLDTAEDYLRRLVATFPTTFTWHYRYAGFLRDHRSAEEARGPAEQALSHAYGDNALRAANRLAEILDALERRDEAREVVSAALSVPEPAEAGVRTHRYRKTLTELSDRLAGKVQ